MKTNFIYILQLSLKRMKSKIVLLYLLTLFLYANQTAIVRASQPNHYIETNRFNSSILGENAYVFNPDMNMKDIQTILDTIYNRQSTRKSEFNKNRYALFFQPGTYTLDVKVGYYMQVYGLGESPDDVKIIGAVRSKSMSKQGHVLTNFWRSIENLSIVPTIDSANIWGVSQAAPLRRIHVIGNLQLHDGGYASGGFLANSKVDGIVDAGQQQQWFTRNSEFESWKGGAWNMMFMGVPKTPIENWPVAPHTVIDKTPTVREKPYLVFKRNEFYLRIPKIKQNSVGFDFKNKSAKSSDLRLKDFYFVYPEKDNSQTINAALQKGKNLLFTPGIYSLDKCLNVTHPGTVVFGIGMATLQSINGNPILEVADVDGVILSGLMLDAGPISSETLLRVGTSDSQKNHEKNPTFLFDIYARVGGPFQGSTKSCIVINSNNVFVDHTWLWRADHGNGVAWDKNRSANGIIVNGNNVTVYGLFNEHFQEYQTLWNGNNGKVYFYQSEMPYDPPTVDSWKHNATNGFASYKVSDDVKSHEAWGVGVYCVFYNAPVIVDRAIETPQNLEKNIHHSFTFWLNGNKESIVKNIINNSGDSVNVKNRKATLK